MVFEGIKFEEINKEIVLQPAPLISVWCITFNHKQYIEACFNGILSQKTDFAMEVVVMDDASTDGTSDIIRRYCELYPTIFHAFIAQKNFYKNISRSKILAKMRSKYMRGEYFAICEGDDYWCDSNKIQLQMQFLQNNPEYALAMHNAKRINYDTGEEDMVKGTEKSHEIKPKEIILQNSGIWPTASMVGKKEVCLCEPFFFECGIGDWPMQLFSLTKGRIYYFSDVMSVYRYMHEGSWSLSTKKSLKNEIMHGVKMLCFLDKYNLYTNCAYTKVLQIRKRRFYEHIVKCHQGTVEDFVKKCEEVNVLTNYEYRSILEKTEIIYRQLYDVNFISEETKRFARNQKKLVVYGNGRFGKRLSRLLVRDGILLEGFAVSNDTVIDTSSCEGMPVWQVSNIPFCESEYGILIAVALCSWEEWDAVKQTLEEQGIRKYFCPFEIYPWVENC